MAEDLKVITGFAGVSLQPNSGAAGEYAGLRVIRAYLESIGQGPVSYTHLDVYKRQHKRSTAKTDTVSSVECFIRSSL